MKALVSGVLLLTFVVTTTCAEIANGQATPADFGEGPLRNPRRQSPGVDGSGPSWNPAEFGDGPLRNPRRLLPKDDGNGPSFSGVGEPNSDDQNQAVEPGRRPTGVGEDGRNVGKENRLPKGNEAEMPSLDKEPFIIIKERGTCSVLPVFDVTRDKLRFQVGRISYASREGAESDAKRLCGNARE